MVPANSSTGLSSTTAAVLAYGAWWVTGLIFWLVERRDRSVRFHAAQATVAFGAASGLILVFAALAAAALSFLPSVFFYFAIAALATWIMAIVVWVLAIFKAARGDEWRIPYAADLAERLVSGTEATPAPRLAMDSNGT